MILEIESSTRNLLASSAIEVVTIRYPSLTTFFSKAKCILWRRFFKLFWNLIQQLYQTY